MNGLGSSSRPLVARVRQILGKSFRETYCSRRAIAINETLPWLPVAEKEVRDRLVARRILLVKVGSSSVLGAGPPAAEPLPEDWRNFLHRDINIGEIIVYPVCLDLECLPEEIDPDDVAHRDALGRHLYAAKAVCDYLLAEVDRLHPSVALIVQGYNLENAVLRQICILRGIPFVSFEITSRRDRLVWENVSGITVNRNLARSYFWRWNELLPAKESDDFCAEELLGTKELKHSEHKSPARQWRPSSEGPVILFLGQVYTDSSTLFGHRPDLPPTVVVKTLLDLAAAHGCNLALKLHPKENEGEAPNGMPLNRLTWRKLGADPVFLDRMNQLGDRVVADHDNRFDTYSMIEAADVVVTVNSQAGLESAIRGKQVVTCGEAFFGGLGFTKEAHCPNSLREGVVSGLNSELEDVALAAARRFYQVFFEKYCIEATASGVSEILASEARAGSRRSQSGPAVLPGRDRVK